MDKDMEQESPKKCFCERCFLPIEPEDKVDIDGQNFHRICGMCCKFTYTYCLKVIVRTLTVPLSQIGAKSVISNFAGICRTVPTSLKMFYGHVFCSECFKNHVLSRYFIIQAITSSLFQLMQSIPYQLISNFSNLSSFVSCNK